MILDSPITRIHIAPTGHVRMWCLAYRRSSRTLPHWSRARRRELRHFCSARVKERNSEQHALKAPFFKWGPGMLSNNALYALFILGHTVFFACFACSLAQESYIFPMTAYGEMEYKRTACETRVIAKTHRSKAFLRVMQLPFPTLLQDVSRSPLRCEKAPRRRGVGLQLLLREPRLRLAISASTVQIALPLWRGLCFRDVLRIWSLSNLQLLIISLPQRRADCEHLHDATRPKNKAGKQCVSMKSLRLAQSLGFNLSPQSLVEYLHCLLCCFHFWCFKCF